jgi:HAD superfamily hydrolase (TIGR01509 family)
MEREARWDPVSLYPATLPTLRDLRERGFRLGLVSDCTSLMGRSILERLGLLPYFDAVALSYEVGCAKPTCAIYLATIEKLGVPPSSCLYVGDGGSDELNGAKALGLTTVRIDQEGCFARTGLPADSDYLIVRLDELFELPPLRPGSAGYPRLDVSWVRPNLAVGGRVDPANLPRLKAMGIDSVVDLRAEECDDAEVLACHGIRFLHLPMFDELPLTMEQMRDGSRWMSGRPPARSR